MTDTHDRSLELEPLAGLETEDPVLVRGRLLRNADKLLNIALARTRLSVRRGGATVEQHEPDVASALKALEFAAKLLGAAPDRVELSQRSDLTKLGDSDLTALAARYLNGSGTRE